MRQRQIGEGGRLDVEATIGASIQSAGYPTLQYKSETRPPEYLILVDLASPRDHEGLWFNLLAQRLQDEGVYVARYFYNHDPRMCWSADGTDRVDLHELKKRHGSHRLLLMGDGDALLGPITGRLLDWASLLLSWQERALLTPEPPAHWSWREFTLADSFPVLPATLDGLLALMDHFDALGSQELRSWRGDEEPGPAPRWEDPAAIFHLRSYLGEVAFRWLCACAIYPELQWGLTLRLGSAFVQQTRIGEGSLLKLFRLPWFRVGAISDEWRSVLIDQLDDATQVKVREALVTLLEDGLKRQEKLPEDSWAADACRFQLAVQQGWLARSDPRQLRKTLDSLGDWPRKRMLRDVTAVGLLERASGLGLKLPYRLRHVLYSEGLPAFGLRTATRAACAVLLTIALAKLVSSGRKESQLPYGRLTVTANVPGAQIAIDGQPDCVTPCDLNLPSGEHLVAGTKPGYSSVEQNVTLAAGQSRSINLQLAGLATPSPKSTAVAEVQGRIEELIKEGEANYRQGKYDAAIRAFFEAIELKPGDAEAAVAHRDLGMALARKKEWDEAIRESRKAIALNPNDALAHSELGVALGHKGDCDGTITEERVALSLDPNNAISHYNLGVALEAKGDKRSALDEFQRAHELDSGNPAITTSYVRLSKPSDNGKVADVQQTERSPPSEGSESVTPSTGQPLGQQTGPPASVLLCDNFNISGVTQSISGPPSTTVCTVSQTSQITQLATYHIIGIMVWALRLAQSA
jgi:Flp pilus assembly protein TadD